MIFWPNSFVFVEILNYRRPFFLSFLTVPQDWNSGLRGNIGGILNSISPDLVGFYCE